MRNTLGGQGGDGHVRRRAHLAASRCGVTSRPRRYEVNGFYGGNLMWKIIVGVIFIIGGLSGAMVLRFTNSSGALAIVGMGLVVWGIVEMRRGSAGSSGSPGRPVTTAGKAAMADRAAKALGLDQRKSKALVYLYEHRSMTIADFEKLCPEADRASLEQDMQALVEMGIMTSDGERFVIT